MRSLFDVTPEGFEYRDRLVSESEERMLLEQLRDLAFESFEMRGVVARRRVAFFGHRYDPVAEPGPAIPGFLQGIRQRFAAWAAVSPEAFTMVLVNEYRPGAPIGWHRDAPQYEIVAGLSLGSVCRMKFRPYVTPRALRSAGTRPVRRTTHEVVLLPRSAYLMRGLARHAYEHSIPPVEALRYSVTFRTVRGSGRSPASRSWTSPGS
jgi:alkylated DNA repair dioxygenase AlkB